MVQRLLYLNFVAMTVHPFEEFGFPRGMPVLPNAEKMKSEPPDRYPQNANSVMIGNMLAVYGSYLLPVFFPNQSCFGLGGVLVGLMQTPVRLGVAKMLKSVYAPGNLAVLGYKLLAGKNSPYPFSEKGMTRPWMIKKSRL